MSLSSKEYLAAFAFSLITLSVWAAHTDSISWEVTQPTTIGSAQVKPGDYQLRAKKARPKFRSCKRQRYS